MPADQVTPAVIYCRVSDKSQLLGGGLESQEQGCRQYALSKGYTVVAVFKEKGLMGAAKDRPALKDMVEFLKALKRPTIIIIDDLKRFARDVQVHFALKEALIAAGGRFESPSFRFEDTPEGKFIETMIAASAELERNQNTRQVRNRMQARLELGLWPFHTIPGYKFIRHPEYKKLLSPDDRAGVVAEALDGYASARLERLIDMVRFLEGRGYFTGSRMTPPNRIKHIKFLLRSPLYAGYVAFPPWQVALRKGHHQALIRFATYQQNQCRLDSRVGRPGRIVVRPAFHLKSFVLCDFCGRPLTASWSTGHSSHYAYYHCYNWHCRLRGKTISALTLEKHFRDKLGPLSAPDYVVAAMRVATIDEYDRQVGGVQQREQRLPSQLEILEHEINRQKAKLLTVSSAEAVAAIDARLVELANEQIALAEASTGPLPTREAVGTLIDQTGELLKRPLQTWESPDVEVKRMVTRLVFARPLRYRRNEGFGTADLTLPFCISEGLRGSKSSLVDLEPDSWNSMLVWMTTHGHDLRQLDRSI